MANRNNHQQIHLQTHKRQYAEAVLSGMAKVEAFKKFINSSHNNPSQGAYRLEHTQHMRTLMSEVGEEFARANSIKHKQLLVMEHSLDVLNNLLNNCEDKSSLEQLATLRLVKALTRNQDIGLSLDDISDNTVPLADSHISTESVVS